MILIALGLYGLLVAGATIWQRQLLYFPTPLTPAEARQLAAEKQFEPWTNAVGEIIGWKMPATGPAQGSVLIVHGNAGSALNRNYIARPIHEAAAVDVYVLEYPGYGVRAGKPSQDAFFAAAEAAFAQMPAGRPRYVVSESIGTGVACELAKNHPAEVAGMVLFVPYHKLAWVAQQNFWFLPAYLFLLDRFDPESYLRDYRGPIKFVIAERDEAVGAKTGLKLARGYAGRKTIEVVPGAYHNEVEGQPVEWWQSVFGFWQGDKVPATQ
ncbi:MAG TPA: alpha/beta fold hydrolase [Verrucomicrobiae bacterium]